MATRDQRQSFILTVRAEPGIDAIKSLRRTLKTMLRRDGLRCVDIREPTKTPEPETLMKRSLPIGKA
jgi:hypothetical protein